MSWKRGSLAALAVCVLLPTGLAGCGSGAGSGAADGKNTVSTAPVGKVLERTDEAGRHYREVADKGAPSVGLQVTPEADGSWDIRLTLRDFAFSAAGATQAVPGRGTARLYVDEKPLADLRVPHYRIAAGYLPHGTHHVTARLYADDGTVWAVDGKPVENTADITASEPDPSPTGSPSPTGTLKGGASPTGDASPKGGASPTGGVSPKGAVSGSEAGVTR